MRTLLIVDDERIIREGMARCLDWENIGIGTVLTACDGKQAYDILKQGKTDIVVSDIIMPELTGIELLEKCRKEKIPVEFIILSSYDDFKFTQKAIKNNVCDYLLKPCNPEELKSIILKLVEKLNALDINKEKYDNIKKRMETLLPHAKSQMLHELLHTLPEEKHRIKELGSLMQLTNDSYHLLLMPIVNIFCITDNMSKVLNDIMKRFQQCVSCVENDQFILLIGNTSQNFLIEVLQYMQKLAEKIKLDKFHIIVSDAINLQHISMAYLKVLEISRLLCYFDKNDIIYASEVILQDYYASNEEMEKYIYSLAESIRNNKPAEALSMLNNIFNLIKSSFYSFNSVREIYLRIYLSVINSNKGDDLYYAGRLTLLNQAFSVQNINDILVQEISSIVVSDESKLHNTYNKAVSTAIAYINENYMDYELSLSKIASKVLFMNADYFGKLFKKECGIKFSNYLLALRMKKAQELLRTTDVSISYVAQRVGFVDNYTYFSQMFKKYTGVLPKDYKNSLEKK